MRVTILGSGTSHGIPVVGCSCDVCKSDDPHDSRSRASILIETENSSVLVDTSTDFRTQAISQGIMHLDAVLMTHAHADHLHGLDDVRSLTWDNPLSVYGARQTLDEIRTRFPYIFAITQVGGGKPRLSLEPIDPGVHQIADLSVQPVPVLHGELEVYGYRIGKFAYLTDCSEIPASSKKLLDGVRYLIIGALRYRPHATHFTIQQAVDAARDIGAQYAWLTHLCHDVSHEKLLREMQNESTPSLRITPGYDGCLVEVREGS